MHRILLDTNIFIYLEDYKVVSDDIIRLTRNLFDSEEYKIVIHPDTKEEINKMKDEEKKKIFLSKISVYPEIVNPPKADKEFNELIGCGNSHDEIDNDMLFAVKRNCVSYLITNDKEIKKKSSILNLEDKVLSIEEALNKFHEKKFCFSSNNSAFIEYKELYNLDINDPFFSSLKADYPNFEKWFAKKQEEQNSAYVTFDNKSCITAFLMLKSEDEHEVYEGFSLPFAAKKRLKISTFKVCDNGKKIGEAFIKIIIDNALRLNVDEIYVTLYKKQIMLIDLLNEYGFEYYCDKKNIFNDKIYNEMVYVKKATPIDEYYPFLRLNNRNVFLVPIQEKYHNLLFRDSEKDVQLSLLDMQGLNTSSNCIKKAYLSDSKITTIIPGSILLFYSSGKKRAITCLGVVDAVFNKFDSFEDFNQVVRKRTAYSEEELRKVYKHDKLVVLFKLYYYFDNPVSYDFLLKNNIVKYSIQSIMQLKENKNEKLNLILKDAQFSFSKYIISE